MYIDLLYLNSLERLTICMLRLQSHQQHHDMNKFDAERISVKKVIVMDVFNIEEWHLKIEWGLVIVTICSVGFGILTTMSSTIASTCSVTDDSLWWLISRILTTLYELIVTTVGRYRSLNELKSSLPKTKAEWLIKSGICPLKWSMVLIFLDITLTILWLFAWYGLSILRFNYMNQMEICKWKATLNLGTNVSYFCAKLQMYVR